MAKKNENDYSSVADQIGDIGGNQEEQGLGKLPQNLMGGKQELSKEEKSSMEAFLARSERNSIDRSSQEENEQSNTYDIMNGWIPIDRRRMGFRGTFYPSDWQIRVRPATVEAIKNWSSVDDTDDLSKNAVFNEVIKECVSIHSKTGAKNWGKIASWDRLWFMTIIREYTFTKGETTISFDEECPHCGNPLHYTLEPEQLHFDEPDPEDIDMSCYNQEDRCWYINPADYGLEGSMIKLYIPTLEKDNMCLNWAIRQTQSGKKTSNAFLRVLPWIVDKASTVDERIDVIIENAKKAYNSWNAETYEFIDNVIKNIQVTPKETLMKTCPQCGEEVHSEMKFPNGFKCLFSVQDRFKKFGKK